MSRLRKTEGRATERETTAAEVALGALLERTDDLTAGARVLVADDPNGQLARGIADAGGQPTSWWRMADLDHGATPWPSLPEGVAAFDLATLRLSKDKEAFEMALHAVASVLRPGGVLLFYGANDEGIKSASKRIAAVFGDTDTVEARRHCRVLRTTRPDALLDPKPTLDAWARTVDLEFRDGPVPQRSYPGVFAKGRLDEGTAALLDVLPTPAARSRVLDFACGAGVIAGALKRAEPTLEVQLLDADAVAAAAARHNVPGALVRIGASWSALPAYQRYDLIVSNPPIHTGKERDYGVLRRLIEGAPGRLTDEGAMWLVLQRQVPVEEELWLRFDEVQCEWEDSRFRVWRAARPSRQKLDL